jgi:hypothetical protein
MRVGFAENSFPIIAALFSFALDGVAQDTHALDLHFEDIAGCMKTGGFRAAPMPPGVPVMIRSPGSRLIATLIISISAETLKMSRSVRASCITRPFKRP